ncbi:MAG: hypothetical protein A3F83_11970 [Candidatus Glassbacteria bacterium RIFCSPLOWO2_12_FULL_58_11]|uniref:Uncharacterized protein n=1 Tax=Candidatus Glassbacteria bacterium RIFCSPLOWO2_12_FULL_58_11 TaxID=1817867 RepID=A0A1F5YMM4_9BACT|nr:MAG: hypothetical protein A3F83_11970 [Candidatus Glassbacteria bacterium RIFCSPLOWO2_12_FULL_58_11]
MLFQSFELWAMSGMILLLLALYIWMRLNQRKQKFEHERKLKCKELILDKRIPLATVGVDFDRLALLVKQKIRPEQLVTVIELLTAGRIKYQIDNPEDPESLEVELNFEKEEETLKAAPQSSEGKESAIPAVFEKLTPEQEKAWFRLAHNRFRKALAEKELKEKQAKFRLLIKMVELGKKAVESDMDKSGTRKAYEISLWDRFYEDEYLALNTE